MRIIMTGGGTGGHIYPAIAIADTIREHHPEAEILFVGTERGMEARIVPAHGYPIRFIRVRGFNRKNLLKNLGALKELAIGTLQTRRIFRDFRPDLVIGTGGYVCGPVVKAAQQREIRNYIHEQNAYPGLTNRILEKKADRIFVGFEEAASFFTSRSRVVVSGNPVRKEFRNPNREACRERLGIPEKAFVILAFGGSGGAARINEEVLEMMKYFDERPDVSIFFASGKVYYNSVKTEAEGLNLNHPEKAKILEYIQQMPDFLGAADLVIGRAGALTTAEITVSGRAAILIPSPNVTGNHQYFNARALSDHGGALLIEEKDLFPGELARVADELIKDRKRLTSMEEASRRCGTSDAAEIIYQVISGDMPDLAWGSNDRHSNEAGGGKDPEPAR